MAADLDWARELLRCPVTGQALSERDGKLVTTDGKHRYRVEEGIPLMAEKAMSADGKRQQSHYDKVAASYVVNLGYPHTAEYMEYLDNALLSAVGSRPLGTTVELCCGRGEATALFGKRMTRCLGVDVSLAMLREARRTAALVPAAYIQGDAIRTPLAGAIADSVVMLGGVHHVMDRAALFAEVHRILKPGGRFYFREPVSDFALWRALRAVIYRLSPALNHETERPLRKKETIFALETAGLAPVHWRTHGLIGFCVFMNSDVLVFNRLFRFVPGIRRLVRASARFDEWCLSWPWAAGAGLQVVGVAEKPLSLSVPKA
jgi:ubiquinone/menaquinone biosynthesis C-methylase UbiE